MSTLLFDIGGTNMRMAIGDEHRVSNIRKIPTPFNPIIAVATLRAYVKDFAEQLPQGIDRACGGIASVIHDGRVFSFSDLQAWDEFDFQTALGDLLMVPTRIVNDAELAGIGEATYGAGKQHELVAYMGIGTGVGGVHIVKRKAVPHTQGSEPGQHILDVTSGKTFEALVSGYALQKRFGKPAKDLPREIYDELTATLAAGLYNAILHWSPDVLVLGGSLMNEENGYRIAHIQQVLESIPKVFPTLPQLVHSALGDNNGLYGALAVSRGV